MPLSQKANKVYCFVRIPSHSRILRLLLISMLNLKFNTQHWYFLFVSLVLYPGSATLVSVHMQCGVYSGGFFQRSGGLSFLNFS